MKKLLLTICYVLISALSYAYDFEVGNLRYTILSSSNRTVEVQAKSTSLSGDVAIPSEVECNGTSFTVVKIASNGFAHCYGIKSITIPHTVTSIGQLGLGWCLYLNTIILDNPGSSFSCGSYAFDYDWRGFTTVKIINSSVKELLEQGAGILNYLPAHDLYINGKKVVDFVVPEGTTAINTCFNNCNSIKSISMPNTVLSIASSAFYNCEALETISLSSKLETIGYSAFQGCASLRTINSSALTPPSIVSSTFPNGTYMFAKLYVPLNSSYKYKNSVGWKEFTYIEEVDNGGNPYLTFKSADNGSIAQVVERGKSYSFIITPSEGWNIESVSFNGENVTSQLEDNRYTTPVITSSCELNIVYRQDVSNVKESLKSEANVRVSAAYGKLNVDNNGTSTNLSVYSSSGSIVVSEPIGVGTTTIDLPTNNIYIVKVGKETFKVSM